MGGVKRKVEACLNMCVCICVHAYVSSGRRKKVCIEKKIDGEGRRWKGSKRRPRGPRRS